MKATNTATNDVIK